MNFAILNVSYFFVKRKVILISLNGMLVCRIFHTFDGNENKLRITEAKEIEYCCF